MADTGVRTYGGWRRSRGMGLFGLGPAQTFVVLGAITLLIVAGSISPIALAVLAVPSLATVGLIVVKWDGVPLMAGITQRVRWVSGSSRSYTSYCSGVMVEGEHAWQLPG
ncbi:MAG TPA: SCO6880 family protein, partial [Mycobacterium sp.]|nr:SCO6880 family protein [Mycobacterium sp.]